MDKEHLIEDRLEAVEIKLAYQEKAIRELNDVIYDQQRRIDRLASVCDALAGSGRDRPAGPANEKPPHY